MLDERCINSIRLGSTIYSFGHIPKLKSYIGVKGWEVFGKEKRNKNSILWENIRNTKRMIINIKKYEN